MVKIGFIGWEKGNQDCPEDGEHFVLDTSELLSAEGFEDETLLVHLKNGKSYFSSKIEFIEDK